MTRAGGCGKWLSLTGCACDPLRQLVLQPQTTAALLPEIVGSLAPHRRISPGRSDTLYFYDYWRSAFLRCKGWIYCGD